MNVIDIFHFTTILLLTFSFFCAFFRLLMGPSLPDRVVSLELMSVISIGIICAEAITTGERVFLEVAVILALVSFLGTIAFAFYMKNEDRPE